MHTTDLIHPPFPLASRLSWASTSSSSPVDEEPLDACTTSGRTYSTYSAALAALARPERRSDEAYLRAVVDSYANAKLAKSKDVKRTGKKLDVLEKHLLHLQIPALSHAIARSRTLHGIPRTDINLPSSWAALKEGVNVPGRCGSTITFTY